MTSKPMLENAFYIIISVAGLIYIFGQVKDALGIGL
jgi:hypothetical protein